MPLGWRTSSRNFWLLLSGRFVDGIVVASLLGALGAAILRCIKSVKSSFVILRQECGDNETNSCYSYSLKGDLEDQPFTISVEGIPLAALFDSCVEGCETSSCYSYSLKGAILRTNPSLYPLRVSMTGNSPSQAAYYSDSCGS